MHYAIVGRQLLFSIRLRLKNVKDDQYFLQVCFCDPKLKIPYSDQLKTV